MPQNKGATVHSLYSMPVPCISLLFLTHKSCNQGSSRQWHLILGLPPEPVSKLPFLWVSRELTAAPGSLLLLGLLFLNEPKPLCLISLLLLLLPLTLPFFTLSPVLIYSQNHLDSCYEIFPAWRLTCYQPAQGRPTDLLWAQTPPGNNLMYTLKQTLWNTYE